MENTKQGFMKEKDYSKAVITKTKSGGHSMIYSDKKGAVQKIATVIRVATVAPIMALIALVSFFIYPETQFSAVDLAVAIASLCVLPILAYPLQKYIPAFRDKGRKGQRTLAMIFANVGYMAGLIYAIIAGVRGVMLVLFLAYLTSGLIIIVSNKLFHLKASGHACGVVGPAVALMWYFHFSLPVIIASSAITLLMGWASVVTKRHTVLQLIGGACVSSAAVLFWVWIVGFII